nr:hypothetical protein [Tanacetum cinerariifolium]
AQISRAWAPLLLLREDEAAAALLEGKAGLGRVKLDPNLRRVEFENALTHGFQREGVLAGSLRFQSRAFLGEGDFERNLGAGVGAHVAVEVGRSGHEAGGAVLLIYHNALVAVGHRPGGMKHELVAPGHRRKVNFIDVVGGLVVVFVQAAGVENNRHVVLGKVVVVRAVVDVLGVVGVVVFVVEGQRLVLLVGALTQRVQLLRQLVGP